MKKTSRIAVASRSFSQHPLLREELLSRYSDVLFNDAGATLSGDSLIHFLSGRERAITALEKIDEGILSELPELKVISKYGVGLDMLDLNAMERRDVLLGWTGGVNRRSVAELVVSSVIALLHKLPEANREVCSGAWRQIRGRQLTGKTVGIVGCGNIGKDLAVILKGFQCRVLAHDISDFPEFYKEHGVIPVGLHELLNTSDVVTLHLPLNSLTRTILDEDRLTIMKKDAILVNLARGGLVDEVSLKKMLKQGKLAGAALDVFSHEPPEDLELLNMPNVIASPHIGGSTEEAVIAMGRAAISGLDTAGKIHDVVPDYLRI
ncbi:MAG: phosphoglycerate dehydrogenase [Syntrophorhabdaceae bacterium]